MVKGPAGRGSRKSARDQAIDKALLVAGRQAAPEKGGTILVRRDDLRGPLPEVQIAPKKKRVRANAKPSAQPMAAAQAGQKSNQPSSKAPVVPKPAKAKKAKKPKKQSQADAAPKSTKATVRYMAKSAPQTPWPPDRLGKAARMLERKQEAARFIATIHLTANDALIEEWTRNVARMSDPQNNFRDLASYYVSAIEAEWHRRTMLARLDPNHFHWPTIRTVPGDGAAGDYGYAEGILKVLGYHVGKSGEQSASRRQALLARVFEGHLPPINGPDYMDGWNGPGTPARLKKMADSIASLASSARGRGHADFGQAIEHWTEDLRFLHRHYYVGRFAFGWPRGGA